MRNKILNFYAVAVFLGIITGTVGSFFLLAIKRLTDLLAWGFDYTTARGLPLRLVSAITSMLMIYMAWLLVKWIATEASGSGVQEIEGTLLHKRPIFWRRLVPVKFVGGTLAIASKLVVGREGPTIQMGGNLGEMLGEWFSMSRNRRDSLIAAGAAAGLATAFNAPLAGILFVMEEMRSEFRFSFTNFTAVIISCVAAVIMLHLIVGTEPAIAMHVFGLPSLHSLWLFLIFGIVVGIVGLSFNILLIKTVSWIGILRPLIRDVYVLFVGFLVGYLVFLRPETVGGGYEIIEKALTMSPPLLMLCWLLVARFITTILSYNVGVPGGFFAPMLAMGTLLGLAASHIFQWVMNDVTVEPEMFAVAGMGALFAAVVRAPITGIVLVVEMTENYSLILPLMVTCLTATTVVQLSGNQPIYTQLLNLTLEKQAKAAKMNGKI